MNTMLRIGHRGAAGHAPENTLISFKKAIELGCDMVEFDVYRCKSGEIVVIHDKDLARTTDGSGLVEDKSFLDLQKCNAGNGEHIPTLNEVLDVIDRRAKVNIELKGPETGEPVARIVSDYIRNRGWSHQDFLASSFDRKNTTVFHRNCPFVPTAVFVKLSAPFYSWFAARMQARVVTFSLLFVRKSFVAAAHKKGFKVFVYTVNTPEDIARMQAWGVDGVFSNYPERVPKN